MCHPLTHQFISLILLVRIPSWHNSRVPPLANSCSSLVASLLQGWLSKPVTLPTSATIQLPGFQLQTSLVSVVQAYSCYAVKSPCLPESSLLHLNVPVITPFLRRWRSLAKYLKSCYFIYFRNYFKLGNLDIFLVCGYCHLGQETFFGYFSVLVMSEVFCLLQSSCTIMFRDLHMWQFSLV